MDTKRLKIGAQDYTTDTAVMPSFNSQIPISSSDGSQHNTSHGTQNSNFEVPEPSLGFRITEAANAYRSSVVNPTNITSPAVRSGFQFGPFDKVLNSQKEPQSNLVSVFGSQHENWGESNTSAQTDTATDVDTDDKNQTFEMSQSTAIVASNSNDRSKEKSLDQKTLRRLAQNREAARKSRLRKKAYVQQLESSRLKLTQLEQEVQQSQNLGTSTSSAGDHSLATGGNGALAFDVEYARWIEEHSRQINELRAAVTARASETEIRTFIDNATVHFEDVFRLKGTAAKADVFHILSGMWKTPAERCFMWIGGFRPSELLKLLVNHLEPLTEQQLSGISNLQQSSQQAEDALSQGMEALQQSLSETLVGGSPGPAGSSENVANYMGQMAMAMGKLGTLESFLCQADNLRQQTLQQMHRVLTIRQSARALLSIHDYFSRLRALSSLWLARPRE